MIDSPEANSFESAAWPPRPTEGSCPQPNGGNVAAIERLMSRIAVLESALADGCCEDPPALRRHIRGLRASLRRLQGW